MNWFKWVSRKELKAQLVAAHSDVRTLEGALKDLSSRNIKLVDILTEAEADLQTKHIEAIRLRGTVHKLKAERAELRDKLRSCMGRTKRVYK